MQIKLKKKNLVLLILSVLFLATISLSVYLLYFNGKEISVYDRLLKHCTEETSDTKRCYVFLKDFREEGDTTYMNIALPEVEVEDRDIYVGIYKGCSMMALQFPLIP